MTTTLPYVRHVPQNRGQQHVPFYQRDEVPSTDLAEHTSLCPGRPVRVSFFLLASGIGIACLLSPSSLVCLCANVCGPPALYIFGHEAQSLRSHFVCSLSFFCFTRMEDITDPEDKRRNPKCDRTISIYGYVRGTHFKPSTYYY